MVVTSSVSSSSSSIATVRVSVSTSLRWVSAQSSNSGCTRSSAPRRWAITPVLGGVNVVRPVGR
jgi:hypothetical protein